jgi:hypothetical protein
MASKKDLCRSFNGLFVRNLGWKVTPAGTYVQHKFYLGRDESKARLASLRLEQLWEQALSFNKLRKTAGNLIRAEAGGEVAAVFLSHGTPVRADELLELYTNRPFARVFTALDKVGEKLRPLWAGVSDPFPDEVTKQGVHIDPGIIRRIQTMKQQGFKISHIAEQLELSPEMVRKWARCAPDQTGGEGNEPSSSARETG